MVCILHNYGLSVKTKTLCKLDYTLSIIVSHEKVTRHCPSDLEQCLVIQVIMSIQPSTRLFARRGIWRVNKVNYTL